jgi:hypothetical protein
MNRLIFIILNFLLKPVVRWHYVSKNLRLWLIARLSHKAKVLEIGSGHNPWFRSNILCDRYMLDSTERNGTIVVDRPFIQGDATQLPFTDKSFDFIFCSHIAEHIDDIGSFFKEIQRVGRAGYIETPGYLFEQSVGTTTHCWALWVENDQLHAERKWVAGAPERTYHGMHRALANYPLLGFAHINIPELKVMTFWWKEKFSFTLHEAPQPLSLTKSTR